MAYLYIGLFAITGFLLVLGGIVVSGPISPKKPSDEKSTPYECGERPIGSAWVQFNVGYYLFALVFLIFEVEAVFLFPCAAVLKEVGVPALIEVGIFVFVLALGLLYVLKKKVMEWV